MAGWIYIFTNDAMPSLVKVGMTKRHPTDRLRELTSSTSAPTEFKCYAAWFVICDSIELIEKSIHQYLSDYRFNPNREFFSLSPEDTARQISMHLDTKVEISVKDLVGAAFLIQKEREELTEKKDECRKKVLAFIDDTITELSVSMPFTPEYRGSYYKKVKKAVDSQTFIQSKKGKLKLIDVIMRELMEANAILGHQKKMAREKSKQYYQELKHQYANKKKMDIEAKHRAKDQIKEAMEAGKKRRDELQSFKARKKEPLSKVQKIIYRLFKTAARSDTA